MAAWKFGVSHAIDLYWRLRGDGMDGLEALEEVMSSVTIDQKGLQAYIRSGGTAFGRPDGWGGYTRESPWAVP